MRRCICAGPRHSTRRTGWKARGSTGRRPAVPADAVGEHRCAPTLQDSKHVRRVEPNRLPADAPNILIVLLDDVGFGLPCTFGGEIATPTLTRLANEGVSYNTFHTTAICSPTRAALLTGRNHQHVGSGTIAERALDWDGYTGVIPKNLHTVAESLRQYGYKTPHSASGTIRRRPRRPRWVRSIAGRPATGSTISMASSRARHRSTSRACSRTRMRSSRRTIRNIT